jgi:hypothetical protein
VVAYAIPILEPQIDKFKSSGLCPTSKYEYGLQKNQDISDNNFADNQLIYLCVI